MPPDQSPSPCVLPAAAGNGVTLRTVVALNLTSTLAQVGQYGVGFVVLPLWLVHLGLSPSWLGVIGALQWFGMLLGIQVAPRFVTRLGARRSVTLGLVCSAAGFALLPVASVLGWSVAAAAIGFGLGLRWISLEPWLYGLIPQQLRGRIVGLHETLIGVAPIAAPALVAWLGMGRLTPTALALGATVLGLLPLAWATRPDMPHPDRKGVDEGFGLRPLALGVAIAAGGGFVEGSFTVLVPLMGNGWGLSSQQMAWLLTVYGASGLLLQLPLGWLADRSGVRAAALAVVTVALLGFVTLALARGNAAITAGIFMLGGSVNAFLTLAMIAAVTAHEVAASRAVARISWYFTASSGVGPLVLGPVLERLGASTLPLLLGAALLPLGFVLLAMRGRRSTPGAVLPAVAEAGAPARPLP